MNVLQLKEGVIWVGIMDTRLRTFDIIMETKFGTTYNSYLVKGKEKTALIETAKANFAKEYIRNVESVQPISEIDYIVVNHTEPDHVGSLVRLLEINPSIEVYGTTAAINNLKAILNRPFNGHPVKEGDTLQLGGKTLQFLMTPQLHWPDTMYTYLQEDGVLFTCDSFGAHYCHAAVLRSTITAEKDYQESLKYYFDCILGPFKPFMLKALDKVGSLPVSMICPGHGPVLDSRLDELQDIYRKWCAPQAKEQKSVVIAYVSAYGYTKAMAEQIAAGIESAGAKVKLYDLETADRTSLANDFTEADGILLGSPTILGDAVKPVYDAASMMNPVVHGKKHAGAFGSYGWSGEAVSNLTERLTQLKMKTVDGLKIKFKPGEEELEQCKAFGIEFARLL